MDETGESVSLWKQCSQILALPCSEGFSWFSWCSHVEEQDTVNQEEKEKGQEKE
jgi:hypothetical protein